MGNRHEPSSDMGCLSLVLAFVALFVVTFCWPTGRSMQHSGALAVAFLAVSASVVSLVLAFIVLARRYPGRGYAVGGTLLAIGAILLAVGGLYTWNARRGPRPLTRCLSSLKQLALAQQMYAEDWDGRLPRAGDWVGALDPYISNTDIFICPADRRRQRQTSIGFETSYTMNELCDGRDIAAFDAPGETVLMFDGTVLYGGHDDAAFRHNDGLNVSFADSRVRWEDKTSFQELRWEP